MYVICVNDPNLKTRLGYTLFNGFEADGGRWTNELFRHCSVLDFGSPEDTVLNAHFFVTVGKAGDELIRVKDILKTNPKYDKVRLSLKTLDEVRKDIYERLV